MPTFNAEAYLARSLDSVLMQTYPKNKIEIIVADGGSTDNTLQILKEYKIKVIHNPKRIAEYGKFLAYQQATGELICLLDADNVIASKDWLEKMMQPLTREKNLLGVESNYFIAKDFSTANTYAALLIIADPLARMLAPKPDSINIQDKCIVKSYKKGVTPVAGANGFIWNKKMIDPYLCEPGLDHFTEVQLMSEIAKDIPIKIANIPQVGIYHYYATTFLDFLKKRRKIAKKHLLRKLSTKNNTWVDAKSGTKLVFSTFFLISIVGTTAEGIYNSVRSKNAVWLLHPVYSFFSIVIYVYYGVMFLLGARFKA